MISDTLHLESPAGKTELDLLQSIAVGGTLRVGDLMPALPVWLQWVCLSAQNPVWELEGQLCGVPVLRVCIERIMDTLILTVKE